MADSVRAIREVNTQLATFASSTLVSYLDRPTVKSAFAIWAGMPHQSTSDASSIQSCEGVKNIFVSMKEFENFSNTVPMPVIIDHLKAKKSTLDESFLIETFGSEFCETNQLVTATTTAPPTALTKIVNQAMSVNQAVTKLFARSPPSSPPTTGKAAPAPAPAPVTPASPATPAMASVVTQTISVSSVASKMSSISPPGKATPASVMAPGSTNSNYSRPSSVYGNEVKSFDGYESEVMISPAKGGSSTASSTVTSAVKVGSVVGTPSASSETGGLRSPFPEVTPQNNSLLAEALKSPFFDATEIFGTAGAHSTPLRRAAVAAAKPQTPAAAAAGGSSSSSSSSGEKGMSMLTIISIAAVVLTVFMQGQIKRGADLTTPLPWVGKQNATGLILRQFETVEKAHVEALTSRGWKVLRKEGNSIVETLTLAAVGAGTGTESKTKYTKISALFDANPSQLMKAFGGFAIFDSTHKEVIPFYTGAELLLTPSSRITLMRATTTGVLPTIPGVETTFALVEKSAKKPLKLDNVKLPLPSPVVIPHGTLIAATVTVNTDSSGYVHPLVAPTCAGKTPPTRPLVRRLDQIGRLLVPNTTLCTSVLNLWRSRETVGYYATKVFGAVRRTTLEMCGKSTPCDKIVRSVFDVTEKVTLGVVGFVQPPPVKTRVDAVYWFVPLPEGGTLMVMVAQGLNDMVGQYMARMYMKTLGAI